MEEMLLARAWSATTLEDEIAEEESLALSERAEADRLLARATDLAAHAHERLATVAAARAALVGERPSVVAGHDEPGCYESLPEWV
jgi:hypothetical protein